MVKARFKVRVRFSVRDSISTMGRARCNLRLRS
jgi:hypothetical protein